MNINNILGLILFLLPNLVEGQQTDKSYINDDVTSIYSTHHDRPFRYGYPYEGGDLLGYKDYFDAYEIDSGLVVAEVGAASGWIEGIFSVFSENVTYYVQDIDTHYLNQKELDAVVTHFSKQRLSPQSNTFHLVIGDETKSNLPDNLFDLIILNNTFHEFSQPEVMIQDLATKLNQDGRIVIREKFSNSEWTIEHNGCRIEAYKAAEVVGFFENEGMFLTKSWLPEFSTLNYLTFEKNENKGKEYRLQQVGIAKGLETLSLLNSKKVLKDSKKLEEVQNVLIEELPRLTEAYPNLPKFFHELAEYYVEKHKLNRALEVLNILDALFPNDVVSPAIKGDIYFDFGLSEEASDEYGIAIRRAPDDVFNYANLVFSLKESSLYELGIEAYVSGSKIDTTEAYLHSAIGYLFLEMVNYFECPYSIESKEIQDLYVSVIEEDDALRFALEAFNKAIVLQPLEPEYLHSRAKVYVAMADYENAIKDYNKILYLNPYDLFVYRLRADAKLDTGDEAGHDADLQKLKSVRKGLKN